ncbi:hypothetical protein SAMN05421874_107232 [Nonomuraea maritima]|uniref:Nitroreductase family protein n=1 Tax=Nonomuraea maritima TaxID=683260 RepID=A0A1G9BN94_9ACTN|nr:hypothetical protein [Nonomuraea maritima]SDK40969.1 hypothetical protein SAMN05421874_107232 [Nonomuraea maritima]
MSIGSAEQALEAAVEAGRWAPSVHNTQLWTFAVRGKQISLRADTARKLPVSDASGREMLISCGAALFTMRTALRRDGYDTVVRVLPDPDRPGLLATIGSGGRIEADEHTRLLDAQITRRHTHRAGFADVPVPGRLIDSLVKAAMIEGARLTPVLSPAAVDVLAALTRAAQGVQSQDQRFGLEIIRWARLPGSTRADGVTADAKECPRCPTSCGDRRPAPCRGSRRRAVLRGATLRAVHAWQVLP